MRPIPVPLRLYLALFLFALAPAGALALRLPAGAEPANSAALGDHGWVMTALRGREIVVLIGDGATVSTLPTPPAARPDLSDLAVRREPLPLVEDGRLAGLVWLEGDGPLSLGVRFARWNGAGWEAPQTVSAPGPGSQLALTAARLGDGTWLLAWSAFDGHDDEIVWSRQAADGTWSAPRRVAKDNAVPDITPTLTATADAADAANADGAALLTWSRFDGSIYQVVTSRFRAGRWDAPRAAGRAAPAPEKGGQPTLENPEKATAAADTQRYIAFGDSITEGFGDTKGLGGYPTRLQTLLVSRGQTAATVVNAGLGGETTAGGLARINRTLSGAATGDTHLLMEGTNDVNAKISPETTAFNLDQIAQRAESVGVIPVHATLIPREPAANTDGDNVITGVLAGLIRELAYAKNRRLVDPFEVFLHQTPDVFNQDYLGGDDKLHPNAKGYDRLARAFADVLTGVDAVPPVTGLVVPRDGTLNVPAATPIQLALYDFGAGIDVPTVKLLVNGLEVNASITGGDRKLLINYQPPAPLAGVVTVSVRASDKAKPANVLDLPITRFLIVGTTFLPADLNKDGRVDGQDLVILALAFGARRFNDNFNLAADFNGDGSIDGQDLAVLAASFGKSTF
jgi:acyl-CoA thioesterase-1